MVSSTRNFRAKKNVGGRPRVGSAHIMLTIPPPLLAELDAFCDQQLDKPNRQEAIRRLSGVGLRWRSRRIMERTMPEYRICYLTPDDHIAVAPVRFVRENDLAAVQPSAGAPEAG
jgi:hypothetical protein